MVEISFNNSREIDKLSYGVNDIKYNLQYLRALSSIFVLVYHIEYYYNYILMGNNSYSAILNPLGYYGVAIFFSISGYLMSVIIGDNYFEFLSRRVFRIYPLFILCSILAICLLSLSYPQFSLREVFSYQITPVLTLAPGTGGHYPLGVEWTLILEVFFYVLLFFISLIGAARYVSWIALLWVAVILGAFVVNAGEGPVPELNVVEVFFLQANLAFALGLLIKPFLARFNSHALLASIVLLAVGLTFFVAETNLRTLAGVGSAALVALAVSRQLSLPTWMHAALFRLGDWSYALYLIHVPVLFATFRIGGGHLHNSLLVGLAITILLVVTAAMGSLDVILHNRSRAILRNAPKVVLFFIASTFLAVYGSFAAMALVG